MDKPRVIRNIMNEGFEDRLRKMGLDFDGIPWGSTVTITQQLRGDEIFSLMSYTPPPKRNRRNGGGWSLTVEYE